MTASNEVVRGLDRANIISRQRFLPATAWPELERARERHERALTEIAAARREESRITGRHKAAAREELQAAATRVLDAVPAVAADEAEDARRRELVAVAARIQAARLAAENAVIDALRLVAEHPEWANEVASRRAAAEAERAELLARVAVLAATAHGERHLEHWLTQAATSCAPQPFGEVGPLPAPPQTVSQIFGRAAA